jgi:hypothetical protein
VPTDTPQGDGLRHTGCSILRHHHGAYTVTSNSNTPDETGTCAFKNGKTRDAGDHTMASADPSQEARQISGMVLHASADARLTIPLVVSIL